MLLLRSAGRPVSFAEIREKMPVYQEGRFDSDRRKFERHKDTLRELGVALVSTRDDGGDRYQLAEDQSFFLDRELEEEDRLLLRGVCSGFATDEGFPARQALVHALAKLNHVADDASPDLLVRHPVRDDETTRKTTTRLMGAVRARHRVTMTYASATSGTHDRAVDPYALFLSRGHWYVVGHCHRAEAIRVFRVARIESLSAPKPDRKKTDFEVPEDFVLADHADLNPVAFHLHDPMEVTLRVEDDVAHVVKSQLPEAVAVGDDRLRVTTTWLEGLVQLVLYFGTHVEVLSPPEARRAVASALDRLLEVHGE